MNFGKQFKYAISVAALAAVMAGNVLAEGKKLVIGAAPGPYADLFKQGVQPGLEQKGYTVEIKEFSDYVQPNLALANKSIDANIFQHGVYLAKFSADKGLKLSPLITVPTAALGVYSRKYKSIAEIRDGSTVTLANDPTNLARALRYMQALGLVKLKPEIDAAKASEKDIAENPKHLKIQPVEAAQVPRTLDSVDIAIANGNYAIAAGIYSTAIDREILAPSYINLIAVRTEDLDAQFAKDIKEVVESDAFVKVVNDPARIFKDFQQPGWLKAKK